MRIELYNEYYPYGLQTANSWTRENTTTNNFLANGGTELNTTTSLYDLDFRNYDPILGRLNQVDPLADKYASQTPYNYAFNNPNNFNDVNGADPLWGLYTREDWDRANMGRDQAWSHGGNTSYGMRGAGGDWSPEAMAQQAYGGHNSRIWSPWGGGYQFTDKNGTMHYEGAWLDLNSYEGSQLYANQYGVDSKVEVDWGSGDQVIKSGSLDLPLALWSSYSFGKGMYDAGKEYALYKNTKALWNEYSSIRNSVGVFANRQGQLLRNISGNLKMMDALKISSKRMIGIGTVIGIIDLANAKPEDRLNKAGWLAADTAMALVGLTGWGAPVALAYFTGRFMYSLYEMSNSSH